MNKMSKMSKRFVANAMVICSLFSGTSAITVLANDNMPTEIIVNDEVNPVDASDDEITTLSTVKTVKLTKTPQSIRSGTIPHYAYGMKISVSNNEKNPGTIYAFLTDKRGKRLTPKDEDVKIMKADEEYVGTVWEDYQVMVYIEGNFVGEDFKIAIDEDPVLVR